MFILIKCTYFSLGHSFQVSVKVKLLYFFLELLFLIERILRQYFLTDNVIRNHNVFEVKKNESKQKIFTKI